MDFAHPCSCRSPHIYIYSRHSINFSKLDIMFDTLPAVLTFHRPVSGHVFCTVRTLSHATNPGTTSSGMLDRGVHQPAIAETPPHLLHVVAPCSCSSRMQHGTSSSTRQTICPQIIIYRCLPPRPLLFSLLPLATFGLPNPPAFTVLRADPQPSC